METTQSHGTPVICFYTWTGGYLSSTIYVTLHADGGFVLGGQFLSEGDCDRLNILTRVEVTNAKMEELKAKMVELRAIAKRGY
jgi:hypothetical protein